MTKNEFLIKLTMELSTLPTDEIEQRVAFYGEMIDDRMEEGLSEAQAVADLGIPQDIAAQILSMGNSRESDKPQKKQFSAITIVLLVLGSPLWLSLSVAALSVVASMFVALWSVIVALWAVFAALGGSAVGGLISSAVMLSASKVTSGFAMLGVALVCAGLGILMFFGCLYTTKVFVRLSTKIVLWVKKLFAKKESVK